MKFTLLIPALTLAALFTAGCEYDPGTPILAEAPGGTHGMVNPVTSNGQYTLFHVTEYDVWGAPVQTEKKATFTLKANEKVGFEYIVPPDEQYELDAHSDVYAIAGSHRIFLGPITTLNDHYYWANPDDWNNYWSTRPERVLIKRATLY